MTEGRETTEEGRIAGSRKEQQTVRRSRTNGKACVNCHQRKIRCDALIKGIPCSNCQSHNRSGCRIYEKSKGRSSLARSLGGQVPIQPGSRRRECQTAPTSPVAVRQCPETLSASRPISSPANNSFFHRPRSASPSAATPAGDCEDEQASRNLADFIDREEIRVRVISDGSRLYFIGTEVSNMNYLVRQRSRDTIHTGLHFGSRQLARKYTAHEFKRIPPEALELPEKTLADELIRAFFVSVNRGWPIVDEEDFMTKYNGVDPRNPVPLPLLHAIFLAGAHVLSSEREELKALKPGLFRKVKTLFDSRFDQDRAMYVQVALLMTWHSDGLEDVVANCWHWVGVAARAALGLGMHRDASQSSMVDIHKRTWVRLWWVLYQFDVMVSTFYGRPQAINIDESDVPTLEPSHFEGIPEAKIDFVVQHSRLCVIFSRAMKQRVSLRSTPTERAEATKNADEALAEFIVHLPQSLRLSFSEADAWQSALHLTYNNFLILLHRPPPQPHDRVEEPGGATDLNICGDAAMVITSIFESLRVRNGFTSLSLSVVNAMFTGLVHVSSEMNSTSPLVAAKSLRMFDSLLLSLRVLSRHWLYARSLLRLFEEQRSRHGQQGRTPTRALAIGDILSRSTDVVHTESTGFSLRPNPLDNSSSYISHHQHSHSEPLALNFRASSFPSGIGHQPSQSFAQSHMYPGHDSPVVAMRVDMAQPPEEHNAGVGSEDVSQSHPYGNNFFSGGMDISGDGGMASNTLPFPEASTLEFLLAGMGNEYEF